ncbi:MAG: hypothetical protein ACYCYP_12535 [Leptospirales bacterium]
MFIKRYWGHEEVIKVPETKEQFLMERGRQCRKCRVSPGTARGIDRTDHLRPRWQVPGAMASAMDRLGE